MMKILINGVGGPTPRSIARALHWYSNIKDIEIIGTDINPLAYGLYEKELYSNTYLVPKASDEKYWQSIKEIIDNHNIDIALVQPELEVIEWARYAQENQLPCKALLPDFAMANLLVDKSKMTDALSDTGKVPVSVTIDANQDNFQEIEKELNYPFWIRSTSGSSGLGSLKVENKEALKNWITINPDVKKFIASEFLPGRNLACKLLYYEGKLIRAACGERVNYIMAKVAPSGITGNTSFGRLLNEPQLVEEARHIMDVLFETANSKKHGFFTVDFKEDSHGKPYVTEVNVRHVAFSMCFAAAGANFAEDTIRLLTNDPSFDINFSMYEFEPESIFLRDVDAKPILMKEHELLKN
ncbi:MAG: ATP-grasp domain-containing protein [Candidatus Cyclobacteriaceae bacterium M2_1C_046]